MAATEAGALSKYRLIAELGRGGMADVYLALASGPAGFHKLVVIKRIREQLADEAEFLDMFLHEARLAARLNHPNVVQTNEVGGDSKQRFIAMEYLEGQPLNRVVCRLGRDCGLAIAMHLSILIEALAGLHYAHELRDFDGTPLLVVHRDMSPHNIFITYSGQVKVVDFGIAKALGSSIETRAGMLKGKVSYMAPEQALGERVDRRADIFSVGVMIWEALACKRLFREDNDITILQRVVEGDIPDLRTVNPDVPAELAAICMKALASDRAARYATAAELGAALEQALGALGERPSLREIGKLVAECFTEERQEMQALVEAQLGVLKTSSADSADEVPVAQVDDSLLFKLPLLNGRSSNPSIPPHEARTVAERAPQRTLPPASLQGAEITKLDRTSTATPVVHRPRGALPSPTSTPPPSDAQRPAVWMPRWSAGFLVTLAFGAALVWRNRATDYPPPSSALSAPEPPRARVLRIESTPPGATVSEGGQRLGTTPLSLSLASAQPAARSFVISLPGYVPYTLEQGPTSEDVRVVVPLLPSGSAVAPSAVAPSPVAPSPVAPSPVAPSAVAPKAAAPPSARSASKGTSPPEPKPKPKAESAPAPDKPPPLPINMTR